MKERETKKRSQRGKVFPRWERTLVNLTAPHHGQRLEEASCQPPSPSGNTGKASSEPLARLHSSSTARLMQRIKSVKLRASPKARLYAIQSRMYTA